jgi:hypothetical protein
LRRLVQLVADYGPGQLAFAELLQRVGLVLPEAEVLATRVPPCDKLAAGFCVARLALCDGPPGRIVVCDVQPSAPPDRPEPLCFGRGRDGVAVIAANRGWAWSFVVGEVSGPCYMEVPAATPAGRFPELLAEAIVRVAERHPHALRGPVPRDAIAPLPGGAVAFADGDGNLASTMTRPPAARGERVRVTIGVVTAPARVAGGDGAGSGELVLRPASPGWPLRAGGRRRLMELHQPGGSAAERFENPPIGAPIAIDSVDAGLDRAPARPTQATDEVKGHKR